MLEIYRDTCASTLILTVVGFLCGAGYNFYSKCHRNLPAYLSKCLHCLQTHRWKFFHMLDCNLFAMHIKCS